MTGISRRKFLDLAAAAVPSLMILPRRVLGGKGYVAPSDKLNIAGIGVGGQGGGDIAGMAGENIVALCDVDWARAAKSFESFPDAKRYRDSASCWKSRRTSTPWSWGPPTTSMPRRPWRLWSWASTSTAKSP